MTAVFEAMSMDNPVFRTLLFYEALLVLKMLGMSVLTAMQRMKNKAFANAEDASGLKGKVRVCEDVERVRRAHLNDLENITVFFVAAWLYMMTNPNPLLAMNLIRGFAAARYMHTIVYAVVVIPQPARALAWGIGYAITGYMAFIALLHYM